MVRAKFVCAVKKENGDGFIVKMQSVTGGSPENDQFFKWTPCAEIVLQTVNPKAAAEFVEGKQYYVDFTQA